MRCDLQYSDDYIQSVPRRVNSLIEHTYPRRSYARDCATYYQLADILCYPADQRPELEDNDGGNEDPLGREYAEKLAVE